MKQKCVTFFLLLVLAIQILPIRQMGGLLFSNQFTEEIPHAVDVEKDSIKKGVVPSDFLTPPSLTLSSQFIECDYQHLNYADAIPHNYTDDIHVPPPNA
ncbi:MAG: hypothetical protein KGO92_07185 [Bacteroidota bacterium]|nr:hypothetical protein [Bacteroidota bacterium]